MKRFLKTGLLILCASLMTAPARGLGTMDYVLDADAKRIPMPVTHQVSEVHGYFGQEGGTLQKPSDLYVDAQGFIYIADTGNNRIVKLDPQGNYVRSYTDGGRLKAPEGVYADAGGDLYIADTQNQRIVHVSPADEWIEDFKKPESDMLEESMDFQVSRLGLSKQGYLYLIKGQHFMTIDAKNEFKGFVGANELGFNLIRLLIRTFASPEQQSRLLKEEPPAYSSFAFGGDGMVYATTLETKTTGQIRKINAVGKNIYPQKVYGERFFNEHTNTVYHPRFIDIAVSADEIIYVLEHYTSQIYVYDQEGNLLSVFGGSGRIQGRFDVPRAIETTPEGDVLVLDGSTGYLHRFGRTDFMKNITGAVFAYGQGRYEESYEIWRKVLQLDVNYPMANYGIAQTLSKAGEYEQAMKYYRIAEVRGGYGAAFSEYRYEVFRARFGWILAGAALVSAGLILLLRAMKKRSDKLVRDYYAG